MWTYNRAVGQTGVLSSSGFWPRPNCACPRSSCWSCSSFGSGGYEGNDSSVRTRVGRCQNCLRSHHPELADANTPPAARGAADRAGGLRERIFQRSEIESRRRASVLRIHLLNLHGGRNYPCVDLDDWPPRLPPTPPQGHHTNSSATGQLKPGMTSSPLSVPVSSSSAQVRSSRRTRTVFVAGLMTHTSRVPAER